MMLIPFFCIIINYLIIIILIFLKKDFMIIFDIKLLFIKFIFRNLKVGSKLGSKTC